MAATDLILARLVATLQSTFRILDVVWKRASATVIEARNAADSAYIIVRGLAAVGANDFPIYSQLVYGVLMWGANSVAATTTTRWLTAGFDPGTAGTVEVQFPIAKAGVLRNLYVRHNDAAGNGNTIVYTVFINGAASTLTVTVATGAIGQSSDVTHAPAVAAGDRVSLRVTKAVGVGASPVVTSSFEYSPI